MDVNAWLLAGGIFLLRVVGNMITTVRLVTIIRGYKLLSASLGVIEAGIFAVALGSVVQNLGDIKNLAAYCLGFGVGGYLGLALEHRLVQRFVSVQVISPRRGHEVAVAIRGAGFGATETWGRGADGQVGGVTAVVGHHQVKQVVRIVNETDPDAFVMMEELRAISRGYFRLARHER